MQPNFILATPLQATGYVMEELTELTLEDLCRACAAQPDIVVAMITEGVIDLEMLPQQTQPEHWRFTGVHLRRARVALRLHRDLGVNFAGAALALQLLDEMQALNSRLKHVAI